MSNKVIDFFITPMEAHFEAVPKDGPRETIISDLEQYASDDLMQAAEWLKRARQAQSTFPSPKECIKAIKAVVGGRSNVATGGYGAITKETYGAAAAAFAKNRFKEQAPVIAEGSAEWEEWTAYFEWLGMGRWIFAAMNDAKTWTVPSYFPRDFDGRFVMPARRAA
jgi:hypothetical protein